MDSAELQATVVALGHLQTTRYVSAAGLVFLLYDHVLSLADEVEYVWSARNTVAKILFLVLRYMVPLNLVTYTTLLLSGLSDIRLSTNWCRGWMTFSTFLGWLTIVISNFLVLLRIWTVVPRGHKLVTWTFGFFVPLQLASFGVSTWVIINMLPLFYADPLTGLCLFSAHPPHVYALWVVGLPFEVLVFGLVSWNALDRPRSFTSDSSVARTLFTDGLLYFMVLTSLRVANTVISATAPTSLLFVGVYFIWAACTTTTTRLIINSRKHALKKAASAPSPQPRDSGTYMSSWTGNWKLDRG